jgi:FkbM family methyltransferase
LSDAIEFGAFAPLPLDRVVIALTSRMPDNWIGLRLAIILRRISMTRLEYPAGALDVIRWGMRLRLHPRDNGCEKNLLFAPQMYEPTEFAVLSDEIAAVKSRGHTFTFVDIGANVGLFSFFVAASAGSNSRSLAIEPEMGNFERLLFNIACNPGVPIRAIPIALSDKNGELIIERPGRDRGGVRTHKAINGDFKTQGRSVKARTLHQLLHDENIESVDALKIDVEGSEQKILMPFFRDSAPSLWPRLLIIEVARDARSADLLSFISLKGYAITARSKLNGMFLREN